MGIITVALVMMCVAHVAVGDLSEQRADFYKSYYEQHSSPDENDRDFHAGSSYDAPAIHHAPSYSSSFSGSSYSPYSYYGKTFDLFSGDTSMVLGIAGLIAGLIAIAALVIHSNELQSLCETGKAIGNVNLAAVTAADLNDAAAQAVQMNLIINAINGVPTPECRD